ncbi:MAG: NAD(P)H-hydrate dehydratase [Hyphomicrobium sp.]
MNELLTTDEMAEADRRAVVLGVIGLTLMENAGRAVADEAAKMTAPGARIAVLCGPGNNGGDGFVAARILRDRGFDVRVSLLGERAALKGDAAEMARRWPLVVRAAAPDELQAMDLVIDALFGAGLSRALDGDAAELVAAINASGLSVLAVDVPSGLNGTTGGYDGPVVQATRSITFFRKKPGHLLMPGRALCGDVIVADIGIPDAVLACPRSPSIPLTERAGREDDGIAISTFENTPSLWRLRFPSLAATAHKYTRGHALVVSGPPFQTGAARMSARAALRIGAGLVTVAGSSSACAVNAAHLTAIMLTVCNRAADLREILDDKRKTAVLIGPGAGVGDETRALVEAALESEAAVVLDADALTSFASTDDARADNVGFGFTSQRKQSVSGPAALYAAIAALPSRAVVLTPHDGEFKRLFGNLPGSKLDRARAAAKTSGAIIVLKGADTVIARADGLAAINANAPPTLATAGSGDVLAGFITGLIAQGMPAFEAACAAVWLHGACANTFGPGLIAEDLPETLPEVLAALQTQMLK